MQHLNKKQRATNKPSLQERSEGLYIFYVFMMVDAGVSTSNREYHHGGVYYAKERERSAASSILVSCSTDMPCG